MENGRDSNPHSAPSVYNNPELAWIGEPDGVRTRTVQLEGLVALANLHTGSFLHGELGYFLFLTFALCLIRFFMHAAFLHKRVVIKRIARFDLLLALLHVISPAAGVIKNPVKLLMPDGVLSFPQKASWFTFRDNLSAKGQVISDSPAYEPNARSLAVDKHKWPMHANIPGIRSWARGPDSVDKRLNLYRINCIWFSNGQQSIAITTEIQGLFSGKQFRKNNSGHPLFKGTIQDTHYSREQFGTPIIQGNNSGHPSFKRTIQDTHYSREQFRTPII